MTGKDLAEIEAGVYVVGEYLGIKPASAWTPPGEMSAVRVPAKLGIGDAEGHHWDVKVKSENDVAELLPGAVKGDRVVVPVRIFAKRGGRGLDFTLATGRADAQGYR